MPIVPFGPWEPDNASIGSASLSVARNVYAIASGYAPVPSLQPVLNIAALPAKCVGLFSARVTAGGYITFAGTSSRLYRLQSGAWIDYTRTAGGAYSVPTDDFWSFAQFGPTVIACNINNEPQAINVDTGAVNFANLGGSPPIARYVTVVGDFVVLACFSSNNRQLRNSAINDATGWTVGVNLCDEQIFPDSGRITGVAGGEFGYVVQESAIRRMIFQPGSDQAFRFESIERQHGCAAGYSLIATINGIFFLANDGFYAFDASGLRPIGGQRINKWFRSNSDGSRFFSTLAFVDPYAPRIGWAFYSSTGSQLFDRVLFYDWQIDRWTYSDIAMQYVATITTAGVTLEDLDVYESIDPNVPGPTGGFVPYSLDSRVWEGGRPVIAAIDINNKIGFVEGATPLTAVLTTSALQLTPSARSRVQAIYPIGMFASAVPTLRAGKREHEQQAATYTAPVSLSPRTGIARFNSSGRLHEVELTITQSAGVPWTFAQGLDVAAVPDGE